MSILPEPARAGLRGPERLGASSDIQSGPHFGPGTISRQLNLIDAAVIDEILGSRCVVPHHRSGAGIPPDLLAQHRASAHPADQNPHAHSGQ